MRQPAARTASPTRAAAVPFAPNTRVAVTVVIPTLNEVDRLRACIESVRWAAQVIVADAGSTDGTLELARALGAHTVPAHNMTIAGQRNAAMSLATQPWILSLDADERVSQELAESIAAVVAAPTADAYMIPFRNQYLGAPMVRGGWGRDKHVRLTRAQVRWNVDRVHEKLVYSGEAAPLTGVIDHDSYRDLAHQFTKVLKYSEWGAADLYARGKRATMTHLFLRPAWRFVRCYLVQGAFREGARGFILACVHSFSAFAKYALLWDLQRKMARAPLARIQEADALPLTPVEIYELPAVDRAVRTGT